jgi:type IV pilus assembly protein PilC
LLLQKVYTKIIKSQEGKRNLANSALISPLEPVMIVFLGTVVGGLVVSMYLPIFKMGEVVG